MRMSFYRFLLIISFMATGLSQGGGPLRDSIINTRYHTYDEIVAFVDSIQLLPNYNAILDVREIGRSTNEDLPIYAFKFSDNPTVDEDEPALLFLGPCHAEEILGVEITMGLVDSLLHGFDAFNSHVGAILQNLEVWIVPTYNPEGLRVVHDGWDVTFRKNKTDNNENGVFDFEPGIGYDIDGVDINRNYDFNWIFGDALGVGDYDYYRGPAPFSENETQAIAALARQEKFLLSVAYHSARSGTPEIIYYSWEWEDAKTAPDFALIRSLAETLGTRVINESGDGNYAVASGKTARGNAHDWIYTQTGAIQFLMEVGTNNLQPNASIVDDTVDRNLEGLFFLMDRAFGRSPESKCQIRGIVHDGATSAPLEGAQIRLAKLAANGSLTELEGLMMQPRVTDGFGRYRRLVNQGTYRVIASAPGFRADTVAAVLTSDNYATNLNFTLEPAPQHPIELELIQFAGISAYEVIIWDDFQRDTLSLTAGMHLLNWQGDAIHVKISAPGYFPEQHDYDLTPYAAGETLELPVDLPAAPITVYSTGFDDLNDWQINSGPWLAESGRLISQPDLFYGSGSQGEMILELDLSAVPDAQRLGIYLRHRYEVEWELDSLSLEVWSDDESTLLLAHSWVDQNYQMHGESIITHGSLPGAARLKLHMVGDSTVSYRGWEIDSLAVFLVDDPVVGVDLNEKVQLESQLKPGSLISASMWPNPVTNQVRLEYQLLEPAPMHIQVYDVRGRQVFEAHQSAQRGKNEWTWHGRDMLGHRMSTGVYFVRLESGGDMLTRKMLMIAP